MKTYKKHLPGFIFIFSLLLIACSSGLNNLDNYVEQYKDEKQYSIVLDDMTYTGTSSKTYKHKYKVIRMKNDSTPFVEELGWQQVSKDFYMKNMNNLEMCILEKNEEGKISKVASPPGFSYVGNPQYGEWKTDTTTTSTTTTTESTQTHRSHGSFWIFYGRYAFLSHMLRSSTRPIYRNSHANYKSGGYYGNKNYYGSTGTGSNYGTNSGTTKSSRPTFFKRQADRVRNSNKSRSNTRSRSSGRSRGGGFGK